MMCGAGNSGGSCGIDEVLATAVVLHGWAKVPTVEGMRRPHSPPDWGIIY